MNWMLEVVVVPVSDVDRAKAFYAEQLGFNVDHDVEFSEGKRIVQLTPPGSGCSIVVGEGGVPDMSPPGSLKGLQLVVSDIKAATSLTRTKNARIAKQASAAVEDHLADPRTAALPAAATISPADHRRRRP